MKRLLLAVAALVSSTLACRTYDGAFASFAQPTERVTFADAVNVLYQSVGLLDDVRIAACADIDNDGDIDFLDFVNLLYIQVGVRDPPPVTYYAGPKHLFVLSGQSNMAGMPASALAEHVEAALGAEHVVIAKWALGGQPIEKWYTTRPESYYTDLLRTVRQEQAWRSWDPDASQYDSVTFLWMQGEADAEAPWNSDADTRDSMMDTRVASYEARLRGLYETLSSDLKRDDMRMIIGRINDYTGNPERMELYNADRWERIRTIQTTLAESDARFDWIDTDDLNDDQVDPIHATEEGYRIMAKRFADAALALLR